ncbi:MAG TPA: hypothetical protein VMX96_09755 [Dehalococcoidia bacterium]|nr:hypothetical protein [Dehalococcoidia bacterium]
MSAKSANEMNIADILQPAIDAMLRASGLKLNQAKTSVYYAVVTWLRNELDFIPILEFRGNSGTGKTAAIDQLQKLLAYPQMINGRTYSDIGANLNNVHTAIIEEGDFKQERPEELVRDRCTKKFAIQVIHKPPRQDATTIYNFGATVIHKRQPFVDTATRNRTIIIKTRRAPGKYSPTEITNASVREVAELMKGKLTQIETSDRISDAWKPLTMVATFCGDNDWLEYELEEMARAARALAMGDQYEPEDIMIKAIIAASEKGFKHNIKLVEIKNTMREHFDLKWSTQKIHAMIEDLGFSVKFYAGYDWLVANEELLERLAKERNLDLGSTELDLRTRDFQ